MLGTRAGLLAPIAFAATGALMACSADDSGMHAPLVYESATHGLSFTYPRDLYLLEKDYGPGHAPRLAVVLVEDVPSNRSYLAGSVDGPMEGPPMITVDVYENPEGLPPSDWVAAQTNWILTDKHPELAPFGERTYLMYYWDGLYAGKSAVAVEGPFTLVLSVTWISETDQLLEDFSALLKDVGFTPPTVR